MTLTEAQDTTKPGDTVTVPADLFLDLVEATRWIAAVAGDAYHGDVAAAQYLIGTAIAINQRAEEWIERNY